MKNQPHTPSMGQNSPENGYLIVEPLLAKFIRRSASKTLAVLQAGRLHNSLSLAAVGIIGLLASNLGHTPILLYLSAWIFLYLGIYLTNDYFDASIDALNKPWKPAPSGRIQLDTLQALGKLFLVIGVVAITLALNHVNLDFKIGAPAAVIAAYLGFEYSRWIKRSSPVFGDIVISVTVSIAFLLPWVAGSKPDPSYLYSLPIYTIALLSREYLKDVDDYRADALGGRMTFPRKYGVATTIRVALILTTLSIIWSSTLMLTTPSHGGLRFAPFTLFSILSVVFLLRNDVSKAQGWLKPALLFHLTADIIYWS